MAPVSGQPCFGSVWWVRNGDQQRPPWSPSPPDDEHPVACTLQQSHKSLRRSFTIEAVPRTTAPHDEAQDSTILFTPAGDPPKLEKDGWLLVRYRIPVMRSAFAEFEEDKFAGVLSENRKKLLLEKLMISRTFVS